jgi:hypothetical protein
MNPSFAEIARQGGELLAASLNSLKNPPQPGPGLDDAEIERLYGLGYRLLVAGQPDQALPVFAFLFAQRPSEARILSGFGHCFMDLGEAGQAAVMHSLAYAAEPANAGHVLAIAEDLVAMEAPMAIDLLQAAEVLGAQGSHQDVVDRARALRDLLSKRQGGHAG